MISWGREKLKSLVWALILVWSRQLRDKIVADGIEAWLRAYAERHAKRATQPQIQTMPAISFDPWSAQAPTAPMGSLLGLDPEKAKRDRLVRAMTGRAQ